MRLLSIQNGGIVASHDFDPGNIDLMGSDPIYDKTHLISAVIFNQDTHEVEVQFINGLGNQMLTIEGRLWTHLKGAKKS